MLREIEAGEVFPGSCTAWSSSLVVEVAVRDDAAAVDGRRSSRLRLLRAQPVAQLRRHRHQRRPRDWCRASRARPWPRGPAPPATPGRRAPVRSAPSSTPAPAPRARRPAVSPRRHAPGSRRGPGAASDRPACRRDRRRSPSRDAPRALVRSGARPPPAAPAGSRRARDRRASRRARGSSAERGLDRAGIEIAQAGAHHRYRSGSRPSLFVRPGSAARPPRCGPACADGPGRARPATRPARRSARRSATMRSSSSDVACSAIRPRSPPARSRRRSISGSSSAFWRGPLALRQILVLQLAQQRDGLGDAGQRGLGIAGPRDPSPGRAPGCGPRPRTRCRAGARTSRRPAGRAG